MIRNKIIRLLEASPCTRADVGQSISLYRMSPANRDRIRQIRVAGNRSKKPGRGWFKTVYYLAGDEERATQVFVDVNAESLRGMDLSRYSALDSGLPQGMAQKIRAAMK